MGEKRTILAIVPQQQLYDKLEPVLRRDTIEVSRAANATSSLVLATNVRYDLIVAEYPLPDLSIVDFLGILQAPTLPCEQTPILLLAEDEHVAKVTDHLKDLETISVISQGSAAWQLQQKLSAGLSDVAVRKRSRLMVQIQTEMDIGTLMRVCQTSNLSESGMLLHTSRVLPIDSVATISFNLPGDPQTIEGTVRVVRHTDRNREHLPGMGVEFMHLEAPARERLRDYVADRYVAAEELLTLAPSPFDQKRA